ncbi:piggyBac transposable element-derived protein 4-like [Photinus pyralis]|uniref:piggyBac transposable element-derived protein 4-like n=1 Tax=Photinus pyralis TaxID=7054 RepID=UPI0012670B7A|nr:piggyBac transposable element-derived protein 4-like [Photinus pyralis]
MMASFSLGEYVVIDEMLYPFRGRCRWIQYIPSKPAKYGIKMYALCDAKFLYTSNLEFYCGRQPEGPFVSLNSPFDVVKRLVAPIANSNRNLTTDNYYTSVPLSNYLLEQNVTSIGTMKKNKKKIPPKFLPNKHRAVQSTLFGFQENKMITSHVPKKNKGVLLLSTLYNADEIDPTTNKPQVIMDYNATKGGVDTVDKMCASYSVSRITRRCPCVIFYSFMNIAEINAHVLHSFAKPRDSPKFRGIFLKNMALTLMKEHLIFRASLPMLPSDIRAFLNSNYGPPAEKIHEERQAPKRGTCRSCVAEKKRTSASIKCHRCNGFTCKRHSKTAVVCNQCQKEDDSQSH